MADCPRRDRPGEAARPAIALRVYAHVINTRLSEAADAFARLVELDE